MNCNLMIRLQKIIYLNSYVYIIWIFVIPFFLYAKRNRFDQLNYLSATLYIMFIIIELLRLYLGQCGNLSCKIAELSSFLMLSIFTQMPLITYFLFNPYLANTPLEVTLHASMWTAVLLEIIFSIQSLKQASNIAKNIYLSQSEGSQRY
ncbi:transmembrane protein 17-like [Leptidea sinapis]|uniref:transmembrane protein 17-like n=1 Tax=Leptidea sinapis TaxID=189913 RepID=UPI00214005B7|nr:transmembrane protein 17-like [Leptidea sinapis]